ncbi:acyltransferase family protein [Xylanibacter ruminicola]|nr:acyltransferase family protein [Xylanibacter ruminicola]
MERTDVKQRIVWIDWAKSICIFLMVVGHWSSNDNVLLFIYSFHMPALFIISGILYKPRPWHKSMLSFAVPVAFFSIINIAFLLLTGSICIENLFSKDVFFRLFHYRYGLGEGFYCGDWFLWALLGLRLFYGDISYLSALRKYYIPIVVSVIVYMSLESHFLTIDTIFRGAYVGRLVPAMPFFCLGFFLKDNSWKPWGFSVYTLLALSGLLLVMPIINGNTSINSNIYGISYSVFFVFASISSVILFELSNCLPALRFVTVISNGTLLVLGLHIPIMKFLDMFFPSCFHEFLPLAVLPICYFPIVFLYKKCPLLLGKI